MTATWDIILILISFVLPPLSVFFKRGLHHEFWLSILLMLLGHFPSVIYAWYVILENKSQKVYHYVPRRYSLTNPQNRVVNPQVYRNQNYGNFQV